MIHLAEITPENFYACLQLQVADHQKAFVAPTVCSLAEAKVFPECHPRVIYDGQQLVGFIMSAIDRNDQQFWIYRLLIDHKFQGNGYGSAALKLVINEVRSAGQHKQLITSFEPKNSLARKTYLNLGFEPTGAIIDDEEVVSLTI